MRVRRVLVLLLLVCGFQSIKTYGQVVATWTDSSGHWSNPANWSTLTVPDNGGGTYYNAVINGTGADTVTFDASGTVVNSLTIGNGENFKDNGLAPTLTVGDPTFPAGGGLTNAGIVNWGNGSNLTVGNGGILNEGLISVNNSNLVAGGYTSPAVGGGGILQLQNGSTGIITGAVTGNDVGGQILIDNSSLNVVGTFGMYSTTVNQGTLRIQGDVQQPDEGLLNLRAGSSAVVTGSFGGYRAQTVLDNSSLVVQGNFGGERFSMTDLTNGSILSVSGDVRLGSSFGFNLKSGSSALVGGNFTNLDSPLSINNSTLRIAGTFTNTQFGKVTVGPMGILTASSYSQLNDSPSPGFSFTDVSGTLVATNSYQQSGGSTIIERGGLIKAGTFQATSGTVTVNGILDPTVVEIESGARLSGGGTVNGNVVMGGNMIAGTRGIPMTFNINGNYTQNATGIFTELISGKGNGLLNISGTAALAPGASLNVQLVGGFDPKNGTSFTIMDYGSEQGTFTISDPYFDNGKQEWVITSYAGGDGDDVVLTAEASNVVTPEPCTVLLVGTVLLGMGGYAKKKRASGA